MNRRSTLAGPLAAALLIGCAGRAYSQDGQPEPPADPPIEESAPSTPPPIEESPPILAPAASFEFVSVTLEVARTDADRARGLGGHAPLGETEGMLFVFERPGFHAFWMKGMTFGLDLMWIEDGRIVHLEQRVPPPGPSDTDRTLPTYSSPSLATYVLEVNEGFSEQHGVAVGSSVTLYGI